MKNKEYVIEEVIVKKNGVQLLLSGEQILISENTYASLYLYPGKVISEDERKTLLKGVKDRQVQEYISRLLSKHRYTYQMAQEKIQAKYKLTNHALLVLLTPYIESGVIDDKSYCLDFIQAKVEAGYGRKYIEQQLIKRGVMKKYYESKEALELYSSCQDQIDIIIKKLDASKRNQTIEKRKELILAALLRRGFSSSLSRNRIDHYYGSLDEDEKQDEERNRANLLKKELQKCYNSFSRKSIPEEKKKDALIRKLLSKGFRYEEIQRELDKGGYYHD